LKQSAIELLEAMCEETHTGTAMLVQNIYKGVDIDALHSTLAYFYKLSQDPEMVGGYSKCNNLNDVVISCPWCSLYIVCECYIYPNVWEDQRRLLGDN